MTRRLLVASVAAALGGCAGGGAPIASVPPGAHAARLASATLTFVVPYAVAAHASARRPSYISSKTIAIASVLDAAEGYTSAQIAAYDAQYGAPVAQTLGNGGSCPATSTGYTCTFVLSVPPGNDRMTLTTYDGATTGAHVLSQMTQTFAVRLDVANAFTSTLDANTATFAIAPPSDVSLSGTGCSGATIAGSGDLSSTCTATIASTSSGPLAFAFSIVDLAGATIPPTTTGFPILSATSSNPRAFAVSVSGETVTVTPVAPTCPAAGPIGTAKITITSTPANPTTDGLVAASITFALATATFAGQRVYVSNYDTGTITVYPAKPVGTLDESPIAEICTVAGASNPALSHPGGIAIDPAGKHLYVTNFDGGVNNTGFVSIFNVPTGFAASAPIATIDDSNGVVSAPEGVTVDASSRVYVTERSNGMAAGSIQIFADPTVSGATAAAAPLASVTGLDEPFGVELDTSGRIYLAQYSANALDIYSAYAAAGVAPQRLSENSTSFPPFDDTVNLPTDVAIDGTGLIYVLNLSTDAVGVYSAFTTPAVAPTLQGTLDISANGTYPYGIAVDRTNGVYVTNTDRGSVSYYAPFSASSPPSAPTGVIAGSATGLSGTNRPYYEGAYGIAIY